MSGCFNCDDPNHIVSKCTKPLNIKKAAASKLDYYEKKRGRTGGNEHLVLAEICYQLHKSYEGEIQMHQPLQIFFRIRKSLKIVSPRQTSTSKTSTLK